MPRLPFAVCLLIAANFTAAVRAVDVPVIGGSFESPVIIEEPFNTPFLPMLSIYGWSETGPIYELQGFAGTLDTGVFYNFPQELSGPDFVADADGDQITFIGAIPLHDTNSLPGYAGDQEEPFVSAYQFLGQTYQQGFEYRLDILVSKSGQQTPNDAAQLAIELIYDNGGGISVAAQTIVTASQVAANDLDPFQVNLGPVDAPDPHLGQTIGVRIRPLDAAGGGGNWTFDHVRVTAVPEPAAATLLLLALLIRRRIPGSPPEAPGS